MEDKPGKIKFSGQNETLTTSNLNIRFGWMMALFASLTFASVPGLTKIAIGLGLNPTTLLAARLMIATLLLGSHIIFTAPVQLKTDKNCLLLAGLVGILTAVGELALFWSVTRIDASLVSMLLATTPLVVLVLLALHGERLTGSSLVRLILGLGGVLLLLNKPGGQMDWFGIALGFVAVFSFGLQLALMQWFLSSYNPKTATLYSTGATTIIVMGFWMFQGCEWHNPSRQGWLVIGGLGISIYLARLALLVAIRHLGSGQLALLIPLETFAAALWPTLLLQEQLGTWQWLGGSLVTVSVVLAKILPGGVIPQKTTEQFEFVTLGRDPRVHRLTWADHHIGK